MKNFRLLKQITGFCIALLLTLSLTAFTGSAAEKQPESSTKSASEESGQKTEKNGSVIILFTSDVHCGVDKGFGYAGLKQIRDTLEKQGYTTLLVDNGDSIQGGLIGMFSKGEAVIDLMNSMHYDAAVPGNHEFDYGAEEFVKLTEKADFPYVSCNFTYKESPVFKPYIIKEAAGIRIAFVGVTTPKTISSSTPKYFQNEKGEFVYGFMQDDTGESVYKAVQDAVDAARKEGADYVYVLGHLGMNASASPWTYADVIEHTDGIDVFLDGHSHDTDQIVMKNKDGENVPRSACGTKMNAIGYSIITPDKGITETDIWSWPNTESAPDLLGIHNEISGDIEAKMAEVDGQMDTVVAYSDEGLTINDPEEKDSSGNPVRMVRRAETNLGDFCADAILEASGAEIAAINGGAIRTDIAKGEITYGEIISVFPFGNELCIIEVTGQQILDALEWGVKNIPDESGGFLQVAGVSYDVDPSVPSPCQADENNMLTRIRGERRVRNVKVGEEPIDPKKTYTLAGFDYLMLNNGDGHTAFNGSTVIEANIKPDNQVLIDYCIETLAGDQGEIYADPYGQGRINILE